MLLRVRFVRPLNRTTRTPMSVVVDTGSGPSSTLKKWFKNLRDDGYFETQYEHGADEVKTYGVPESNVLSVEDVTGL